MIPLNTIVIYKSGSITETFRILSTNTINTYNIECFRSWIGMGRSYKNVIYIRREEKTLRGYVDGATNECRSDTFPQKIPLICVYNIDEWNI